MSHPDHVIDTPDGVPVAVHELGGDGPPVVLCHATGFHARCWEPTARRLADRYRCVAVDLRGHGDTPPPDDLDLRWAGMARDVLAVIDALDLGQVRAAGWSMGGAVITIAEILRPGTIRSGFLFEPILFPAPPADLEHPLAPGARKRREVFASRDEAYAAYEGRGPFARATPEGLRAYVDHGFRDAEDGSVVLKCRGETEAQVYEAHDDEAWERLGEVGVDLVVGLSGDGGRPAELGPLIVDRLPGSSIVRLDDLTHMAPLEGPDAVAAAISDAVG
ncbi:MAG: alpha/beta hydrolase [Actinomycetota bacterium]